jgi:hypothetical protein
VSISAWVAGRRAVWWSRHRQRQQKVQSDRATVSSGTSSALNCSAAAASQPEQTARESSWLNEIAVTRAVSLHLSIVWTLPSAPLADRRTSKALSIALWLSSTGARARGMVTEFGDCPIRPDGEVIKESSLIKH